jgi:2-polyprenyl-3-methyl-5-hydroxy-6-metoxy-1,4-benzoquinol methylase
MSPEHSRYANQVNLRDINSAHALGVGRVPANSRVLDIGAADGSVARMLRAMGCRIWGIEVEAEAAAQAAEVCERVVNEDLNDLDFAAAFDGQKFDVVLMLDVLEHLPDPAPVLRRVASVLDEGGWAVISLPNVAHVSVRLALLEGRFAYTDLGLLDRTHLRFFTREGVDDLLAEAGWGMFELQRVHKTLNSTEIKVDDADPQLVDRLHHDEEGLTYQFVLCAAPLGSPVLDDPPAMPGAVAQGAYLEVSRRLEELERLVGGWQQVGSPNLWEQLNAIRQGSLERRDQLKGILATLRAR